MLEEEYNSLIEALCCAIQHNDFDTIDRIVVELKMDLFGRIY